jgi:hypothetical protein
MRFINTFIFSACLTESSMQLHEISIEIIVAWFLSFFKGLRVWKKNENI